MDKFVMDQAEGLRRLLARRPLRVVTLLAARPGAGATTAALNLAAGLRHQGKRALVIDEHAVAPQGDRATAGASLVDVLEDRMLLDSGFFALDEKRAPPVLAGVPRYIDGETQIRALDGNVDVVCVDAALDASGTLSPLAGCSHDIVIVMDPDAASMTAAYGLIKKLHLAHGSQQFRLLFNRVALPADAQGVYQNLSGVAMRYLGISLTPAGVISRDKERLARAASRQDSVVSAYPTAPASIDYRRIAADMLHWPWRPIVAETSTAHASSSEFGLHTSADLSDMDDSAPATHAFHATSPALDARHARHGEAAHFV